MGEGQKSAKKMSRIIWMAPYFWCLVTPTLRLVSVDVQRILFFLVYIHKDIPFYNKDLTKWDGDRRDQNISYNNYNIP